MSLEIPEVKLQVEYLKRVLVNKVITNWVCIVEDSLQSDDFEAFYDALPLIVEDVEHKGKLIYITCFSEYRRFYILQTGGLWKESPDVGTRWYMELNGKKVWFSGEPGYGAIFFTEDETVLNKALEGLGPDVMDENFSLKVWKSLVCMYKDKRISSFLTTQKIVSGLGNYLKSEALYYSKISPLRKVSTLTEREIEKLYEGIRVLSRLSYVHKGLYTDSYGKKGFFEFHLKVYGKPWAKKDKRDTYWNPKEQK